MFTVSLLSLQNVYYYDSVYVISFHSHINPDQLLKRAALPCLPQNGIRACLSSLLCLRAWLSFIAHLFLKLIEMTSDSRVVHPQIPVLSERNYDTWFIKMRTILCDHDLWEFVTIGYPEPADQATELALSNVECVLLEGKSE